MPASPRRLAAPVWVAAALLAAALLAALAPSARAEEAQGDAVVLPTGQRLACQVLEVGPRQVRVRVGAAVYALERAGLAIEAADASAREEERARRDLVAVLVPRLVAKDPLVAAAARTALRTLGEAAHPALRAARAEASSPALEAALDELLGEDPGGEDAEPARGADAASRFVEGLLERARATLDLREDQVAPFREALLALLRARRAGTPREEAMAAMRVALEDVLDEEQQDAMDEMFQGFGGGRR